MKGVSRILLPISTLILSTKSCRGEDSSSSKHGCVPGSNKTNIPAFGKTAKQNFPAIMNNPVFCVNNSASGFPCKNMKLESFIPNMDLNGGVNTDANDIWGWTSPKTGIEYAIFGLESGTSFVSLENPSNPKVLGVLDSHTADSWWRDIKTYNDYAFIVSEAFNHGMQIFDLTILDDVTSFTYFSETAHYNLIGSAHNIGINEDTGFAYIVGAYGAISCNQGIHIVDILDPLNATFSACYSPYEYTHDLQCVTYNGPDLNFVGKEICFACDEDQVDIIDVSNKWEIKLISTFVYDRAYYVHQGWLTEDHHYFIINDEDDELFGNKRKTYICDVSDLRKPSLKGVFEASSAATDHNLFVKGNYVYQANYRAGLHVLDLGSISTGDLAEVAYFDVFPTDNTNKHNGAWGTFPFFDSGLIIVSSIERGLFVLRLDMPVSGCLKSILNNLWDLLRGIFT